MENKDILIYILIGLVLFSLLNTYILQKKVSKIMSKLEKDIKNQTPSTATFKTTEKFTSEDVLENYSYSSNSFSKTGNKKVVTIDNDGNMDMFEFPKGMIVAWAGASNNIPDGWSLCDGNNETPNLQGKFILGTDDNDNTYAVGKSGGEETHTLTIEEMPSHSHFHKDWKDQNAPAFFDGNNGCACGPRGDCGCGINRVINKDKDKISQGGDKAHNNMPPYFALCYIMKKD